MLNFRKNCFYLTWQCLCRQRLCLLDHRKSTYNIYIMKSIPCLKILSHSKKLKMADSGKGKNLRGDWKDKFGEECCNTSLFLISNKYSFPIHVLIREYLFVIVFIDFRFVSLYNFFVFWLPFNFYWILHHYSIKNFSKIHISVKWDFYILVAHVHFTSDAKFRRGAYICICVCFCCCQILRGLQKTVWMNYKFILVNLYLMRKV